MKLRIRGNSIRIRLGQTEVARLADGQSVEQITEFSSQSALRNIVEPTTEVHCVQATFDRGCVLIRLPLDKAKDWANSDRVGIEAEQAVADQRLLKILIEKDFECLHSRVESITDAYPNPRNVDE